MVRRTLTRQQREEWRTRVWHVLILVAALFVGGVVAGLANTGWLQHAYWSVRLLLVEILLP